MPHPIPPNEAQRLIALRRYEIMDTASERAYDEFVALTARLFSVPTAMIVLLDAHRQWFKARVGMTLCETPREQAFCSYAILQDEVMVIEDARLDARTCDNPLVYSDPPVRFYAGAPLITPQGYALGTLCVVDSEPRAMTQAQCELLAMLARQVVTLLELRRSANELALALRRERQLHALVPICAYCKSVRDDEGYWQGVESYIHNNTGVALSHGICPDCMKSNLCEERSEAQGD